MLDTVIAGIGAGITYSLTGYGKNKGEPFDTKRFLITAAVGGLAGICMALLNVPVDVSYQYLIGLGIVPAIENVTKTIQRRLLSK